VNTQLTPTVVTTVDQRDAHLVREILEAGRILQHATNRAERYVRIARLRWYSAQAALAEARAMEAA
jgi:hypothetical protein